MRAFYRNFIIAVCISVGVTCPGFAETSSLRRTPTVIAVEKVSPAVVNISTEKIVRQRSSFGFSDPFFDQFFRDFLDPFPRRQYKQNSLGSGVIIDDTGYILTNQHVILKASKITITLADNREFEGELVGSDARLDLAIVKILTKERLPVATIGTSGDLMIGEPVIAIGNPFGLSHTITTGVISALNRTIRIDDDLIFRGFIQTDAPINPGNSGGPLINIFGDVIGINTAIYGNAQGIGFAIPVDKAKRVIDDLISFGEVRSAWIGIMIQDITPHIAQYFNYNSSDGVLIAQVSEKSSAERAGLQQGDIIVALDNNPVRDQQEYYAFIAEYTPGDIISFSIIRNEKSLDIEVTAEEFSTEQAVKMVYQGFGLYVEDITQRLVYKYLLQSKQGVVVTKVQKDSSSDRAGVEPGDIIRQVEQMQITDLTDFRKAMVKVNQKTSAVFLVQRKNRGYYITLERQ
jgi:serine protease Do